MLRTVALSLARRSGTSVTALSRPANLAAVANSRLGVDALCAATRVLGLHTSRVVRAEEPETTAVKAPRKRATTATKKASSPAKKAATKKAAPKKAVKTKKAPKAKPAPKRVLNPPKPINSAWVLYFKEQLDTLPKEEKKSVTELSKQYVVKFRNLSTSERSALDERLQQHKQKYEQEMEEYKRSITPEMIQAENQYRRAQKKKNPKRRSLALLRDPTKPTMPLNGFFRFSNKVRSDSTLSQEVLGVSDAKELPFAESGKKIADVWKSMSTAEQEPYQSEYEREKATFDKELAEWKAKNEKSLEA